MTHRKWLMFAAVIIFAALLTWWIRVLLPDTASWWWLPWIVGIYVGQFGRWVWDRWLRA
jgi:hypothetical protein